jgi:Domain of unknown function (DUF4164)
MNQEARMAQPPSEARDDEEPVSLDAAAKRLERALALLEGQVKSLSDRADGGTGGLFDLDRSQLAAELDAARAREKELTAAGAEASAAIGRAIEGIRAALERVEEA